MATRRFASSEITLLFPAAAAATATAPVAISQQAVTSLRLKSEGGGKYSFKSTNYIFFFVCHICIVFWGDSGWGSGSNVVSINLTMANGTWLKWQAVFLDVLLS